MHRAQKRSGLLLGVAVLLLPSMLLAAVCPQMMRVERRCMSMPMPVDKDHGMPACCVQHHLPVSIVPSYRCVSPSVYVAEVVRDAVAPTWRPKFAVTDVANYTPSPPGSFILRI